MSNAQSQVTYQLPAILVVDDDEDFGEETADALRLQGWEASTARSASEALLMLDQSPSDYGVIISDIYMPGVSGVRLAREIKARLGGSSPEVILITGHPNIDTLSTAIRLQVVDFLTKPVRQSELLSAVDTAVDRLKTRQNAPAHPGQGSLTTEPSIVYTRSVEEIDPLKLMLDVNQAAMDHLAADKLDHQQIRILVDIAWHHQQGKQVTVTGLAYGLSVPVATSHRKLKDLEKRGFIQRTQDENDGRLTYVQLTEEGFQAVDRLAKRISKKLSMGDRN